MKAVHLVVLLVDAKVDQSVMWVQMWVAQMGSWVERWVGQRELWASLKVVLMVGRSVVDLVAWMADRLVVDLAGPWV